MVGKRREDPANGGRFIVIEHPVSSPGEVQVFEVKGYTKNGRTLLHTWHKGEHSMLMEVRAWCIRGARPDGLAAEVAAATVAQWK